MKPRHRRVLPWLAAGAAALAVAIAGCGGYSSGTAKSAGSGSAHHAVASGIPQNNGGDMDADNNGGPSDGDGNQ